MGQCLGCHHSIAPTRQLPSGSYCLDAGLIRTHMETITRNTKIVLVGMPGVGKSTVGVLLAKVLSRGFVDTDVYIQAHENRRLQDILDKDGRDAFCRVEETHIARLECTNCVIATGGSVIYSDRAMKYLKTAGVVVYLTLPLDALQQRLTNLPTRGVVMTPGQDLNHLYEERDPLYRKYADVQVNCSGLNHEQVVAAIRK